ncbi:MAG: T9SS type A sorting domain-containing protein [Saprospiraceae bacterium]|nr:T9SS type A sorting domain-containing protein [Saprospiraceae bacterium]
MKKTLLFIILVFVSTIVMSQIDLGITEIKTPNDTTLSGSLQTVEITIKNFGIDTFYSTYPVTLNYQINNNSIVSENLSGTIDPNLTTNFTFSTTYISPATNYSLCVWIATPVPSVTSNDTLCKNIVATPAAYDVGLAMIEEPIDTLNCKVKVWIKNYGLNTVSSTDVFYHLNGWVKKTQTWTGSLNPNDSVLFTFINANPPIGTFTFCAGTEYIGDLNHSNDSICKSIIGGHCCPPPPPPWGFSEIESSGFILNQNIPNPTSGKTQISYTVSKAGEMRFELINVFGQIMQFQEKSVLPGTHNIELSVGDLSAGIYYYSVIFEGRRLVKKMVISRQ